MQEEAHGQHVESARRFAQASEVYERDGRYAEAANAHAEAARLYRLASVGAPTGERKAQEQRMLARHHDGKAKTCRDLAAAAPGSPLSTPLPGSTPAAESALAPSQSFMIDRTPLADAGDQQPLLRPQFGLSMQDGAGTAAPTTPGQPASNLGGWVEAFEALIDRLFAPYHKEPAAGNQSTSPQPRASSVTPLDDDQTNKMIESFYVLPDYGSNRTDLKRSGFAQEEEFQRLREAVERLSRQNEALLARVNELESEKQIIKQSVMQFRHELERSVVHPSVVIAPGLVNLLESEAASVIRTPSPGPDLVGYIRQLERRVEEQAAEVQRLKGRTKSPATKVLFP